MARVRRLEIQHFRGIAALDWYPSSGVNCLIGSGDSGKTTVLDAIDLCIGARRSAQFSDADFHSLDTSRPICIRVTLGDLPDALRSMETYGPFLRGFVAAVPEVSDEPVAGGETVLTVQLSVSADLEPVWSLVSDRMAAQNAVRSLSWSDRVQIAPTRIGGSGAAHLAWRRGAVLTRLTDETIDSGAAMRQAMREARAAFTGTARGQLTAALAIVDGVAANLGISIEGGASAALDPGSAAVSAGTVTLHDSKGVPLTSMGVGSTRLLVAGLQRKAAAEASIALIDELEHGLEPHRIIALLNSLGVKDDPPPLQVFATTHSPVAVRELTAGQLNLARRSAAGSAVVNVGQAGDVQGTVRAFPEAFLARSIIVCEGASEVGLLRGLDRYRTRDRGAPSLMARAVALVDAGGVSKVYGRASAFVALGYRATTFRDDDVQPDAAEEAAFLAAGGNVVSWGSGRALEDALFAGLAPEDARLLLHRAIELHGEERIDANIRSASAGALCLSDGAALLDPSGRSVLAKAARAKPGWFKTVSWMEDIACDIVGPGLPRADAAFRALIEDLVAWTG